MTQSDSTAHDTQRITLRRALTPLLLALCAVQIALLVRTLQNALPAFTPEVLAEHSRAFLIAQLLSLCGLVVLMWRVVLVHRYRPVPSVADDQLPLATVIVPAYNEGHQVLETIKSLVRSDYPQHKLQIIAVDDGSQDDTWFWIRRAATMFPDSVTALRGRVNRGKRAALYEGFERARGEVIVTVDSDSEVLADTLRNLVSPMVVDPRIGAVAGNVRVLNEDADAIAAMMDVTFTASFEFLRASESMVGTVMCCPGALTAYRRTLIDDCKDEWVAQSFLGQPSTIGEDRALTNLILRSGHTTCFQSNAIVRTEVPNTTEKLAKMLLRWARSNVRETLVMMRFAFTRFRDGSLAGTRINLVTSALRLLLAPLLIGTVIAVVMNPMNLVWIVLGVSAAALWPAAIYACLRSVRGALWAIPYGVYSFLCLSWITPYALITPHRSSWLTRELALRSTPVTDATTNVDHHPASHSRARMPNSVV